MPGGDASDPVREAGEAAATLRERYDELARIEARIADLGRDRIETAADAYRRAHRVLDQYEEDAVGTGDFGSYVQFRGSSRGGRRRRRRARGRRVRRCGRCGRQTPALGDRLRRRPRRVGAGWQLRRPARRPRRGPRRLPGRAQGRERPGRRSTPGSTTCARSPGWPTRTSTPTWTGSPRADRVVQRRGPRGVRLLYKSASARDVFSFLDRADGTPFVDADVPPTDLREYVTDYDAGEEPLPTLLEYADYSNSKLEHYVDDPARSGPRSRSTAPTSSGSTPSR